MHRCAQTTTDSSLKEAISVWLYLVQDWQVEPELFRLLARREVMAETKEEQQRADAKLEQTGSTDLQGLKSM